MSYLLYVCHNPNCSAVRGQEKPRPQADVGSGEVMWGDLQGPGVLPRGCGAAEGGDRSSRPMEDKLSHDDFQYPKMRNMHRPELVRIEEADPAPVVVCARMLNFSHASVVTADHPIANTDAHQYVYTLLPDL